MITIDLMALSPGVKDVRFEAVGEKGGCKLTKVWIKAGAVLARHVSPVPASVLAVSGTGIFEVSGERIHLKPGVIVSFDAMIPHEARAESDLTLLVVKYPPS